MQRLRGAFIAAVDFQRHRPEDHPAGAPDRLTRVVLQTLGTLHNQLIFLKLLHVVGLGLMGLGLMGLGLMGLGA
jgi:hypothetical protein